MNVLQATGSTGTSAARWSSTPRGGSASTGGARSRCSTSRTRGFATDPDVGPGRGGAAPARASTLEPARPRADRSRRAARAGGARPRHRAEPARDPGAAARLNDHLRSEMASASSCWRTMAGSRSWALTKPLRAAGRAPPGAQGRVSPRTRRRLHSLGQRPERVLRRDAGRPRGGAGRARRGHRAGRGPLPAAAGRARLPLRPPRVHAAGGAGRRSRARPSCRAPWRCAPSSRARTGSRRRRRSRRAPRGAVDVNREGVRELAPARGRGGVPPARLRARVGPLGRRRATPRGRST